MILSKIYPKIFIGFTCIFLIVLYNLLYTAQRVQCITPQSSAYTVLMQHPSVTEKIAMVLQTHNPNTVFFGDFYLFGDATRPDSENGSLCLPYLIVESNPVYTAGTTSWKFYLDVLQFSNSGRILLPNELELSLVPDANTTLGLVTDSTGQGFHYFPSETACHKGRISAFGLGGSCICAGFYDKSRCSCGLTSFLVRKTALTWAISCAFFSIRCGCL